MPSGAPARHTLVAEDGHPLGTPCVLIAKSVLLLLEMIRLPAFISVIGALKKCRSRNTWRTLPSNNLD